MESFVTKFENHRKETIPIYEGRQILCWLGRAETISLECLSSSGTYSRWDSVIFKEGEVELHVRDFWREPDRGPWVVEFLNVDGGELEERIAGGNFVSLPKGIPILVGLDISDYSLIRAKRIEIRSQGERVKSEKYPGYFRIEMRLKDIVIERDEAELKKIDTIIRRQNEGKHD